MEQNQQITYFSTFSGVGGFEIGIQKAIPNAKCVGMSEIDKQAISILKHKFKGVKNYGDITKIKTEQLPNFDMLCGGFPCQAFSIAGKRMGFEDTRGTLFFELARIAKSKRPKILFLENVAGLLSHEEGRTITTILKTLDELGYDAEWQVLNSKHFGVPQNRERIIIVGHLRGQPRLQVFPIPRATGWNTGKSKGKGLKQITEGASQWDRVYDAEGVASTLTRNGSEKGLYKIKEALEISKKRWGDHYKTEEDISNTLMAVGKVDVAKVITPTQLGNSKQFGNARKKDEDGAFTLRATQPNGVIVHSLQTRNPDRPSLKKNPKAGGSGHISKVGEAYCLDTGSTQAIEVRKPVVFDRGKVRETEQSTCIDANYYKGADQHGARTHVQEGVSIRRLTPIECERLQGFPDNWTQHGINEKGEKIEISDNQRYKMMGNAVTTKVIQAVASRIKLALLLQNET